MKNTDVRLSEIIPPSFFGTHRLIKEHAFSEYVLTGGRGSCKSSFISEEILLLIKKNPDMHCLVLRKYGNTVRDSVYNQLLWAADMLKISRELKTTVSPPQIVYKPTGQTIYFRGLDKPEKIKSIRPDFGYIGIIWFEEFDQFAGIGEIRSVEQSAVRGGNKFYIFKSFNPPVSAGNWANRYVLTEKKDMTVVSSDYLSVPKQWLGEKFLSDAEYLRSVNEKAYRHEYLGIPTGTGGNVFENVIAREISESEIKEFDNIYMGIDWGWYPDPFAFVKMTYIPKTLTLIIFDEYRCNKKSNRETADILLNEKGVTGEDIIICDSAENKSVSDYREYGIKARAAEKFPGSVSYSVKWLQSLNEIVIDPKRCPETYKEFIEYEYERTKDGEIISGYPDRDNHSIDAVRYAMSSVWRKRGK